MQRGLARAPLMIRSCACRYGVFRPRPGREDPSAGHPRPRLLPVEIVNGAMRADRTVRDWLANAKDAGLDTSPARLRRRRGLGRPPRRRHLYPRHFRSGPGDALGRSLAVLALEDALTQERRSWHVCRDELSGALQPRQTSELPMHGRGSGGRWSISKGVHHEAWAEHRTRTAAGSCSSCSTRSPTRVPVATPAAMWSGCRWTESCSARPCTSGSW